MSTSESDSVVECCPSTVPRNPRSVETADGEWELASAFVSASRLSHRRIVGDSTPSSRRRISSVERRTVAGNPWSAACETRRTVWVGCSFLVLCSISVLPFCCPSSVRSDLSVYPLITSSKSAVLSTLREADSDDNCIVVSLRCLSVSRWNLPQSRVHSTGLRRATDGRLRTTTSNRTRQNRNSLTGRRYSSSKVEWKGECASPSLL